jgi:hypothetical protein
MSRRKRSEKRWWVEAPMVVLVDFFSVVLSSCCVAWLVTSTDGRCQRMTYLAVGLWHIRGRAYARSDVTSRRVKRSMRVDAPHVPAPQAHTVGGRARAQSEEHCAGKHQTPRAPPNGGRSEPDRPGPRRQLLCRRRPIGRTAAERPPDLQSMAADT